MTCLSHIAAPDRSSETVRIQRKCACGAKSQSGGMCKECTEDKMQRKLVIGSSNDPLEADADRIAQQVLSSPVTAEASRAPISVRRFTDQGEDSQEFAPASVARILQTSGRPLDEATRIDMGSRFGHDFSRVRIHDGPDAARSAKEINARAYTAANHIVFDSGNFTPGTASGLRLIAHELAHVVQQGHAAGSQYIRRQTDLEDDEPSTIASDDVDNAIGADEEMILASNTDTPVGVTKSTPKTKKEKPKKPKNPCTREILSEGTCKFLVDNSKYVCCDEENGVKSEKRTTDIDGNDCPSMKFTPIFTCDNKCDKALEKGCDDNDNWMALPKSKFKKKLCGTTWTICANGKQTTGYVRDQSVTKSRFEVSPGIQATLGVTGSFLGSVWGPGAKQSQIDADKCCKS